MLDEYAVEVLEKKGWRIFDGAEASRSWPKIKEGAKDPSNEGHAGFLEFRDLAGDTRHQEEAVQISVVSQIFEDLWVA